MTRYLHGNGADISDKVRDQARGTVLRQLKSPQRWIDISDSLYILRTFLLRGCRDSVRRTR